MAAREGAQAPCGTLLARRALLSRLVWHRLLDGFVPCLWGLRLRARGLLLLLLPGVLGGHRVTKFRTCW
jgi:hypothetical protein